MISRRWRLRAVHRPPSWRRAGSPASAAPRGR
jgi:hypothetical protein